MAENKIVLIDGHSILFRAFYGMPDMTNAEGLHTNAVFGFMKILFRILDREKPDHLVVAFDTKEPTFRHKTYEAYKGNRTAAPPEFHEQVPVIREVLDAMGIRVATLPGYEADDILGTLANRATKEGLDATVVSGDHDLLQIASDRIKVSIPSAKGGKTEIEDYYDTDVVAKHSVTPTEFIDVKALMGDSSDNIPGVPGIGRVNAEKLISAYGSIENAHEHAEEVLPKKIREALTEHYDLAVLSKDLATIRTDAPVELELAECRIGDIYTKEAYEVFKKLGFRSLYDRFALEEKTERTKVSRLSGYEEWKSFLSGDVRKEVGCALCIEGSFAACAVTGESGTVVLDTGGGFGRQEILAALTELADAPVRMAVCGVKDFIKTTNLTGDFFDPVIAAYLIDPLKSDHDYDSIASTCLSLVLPSREERIGKKGIRHALEEGREADVTEMLIDASETAKKAMPVLLARLENDGMTDLFRNIEMPLAAVLADMELAGIGVDPFELAAYGDALNGRIGELTSAIYAEAQEEFNINSPKQLGVILFEKMGLPGGKKTKTGFSTAADVLEKLAADHPIVEKILEYRQLTKLKSTYADGLSSYIAEDGRIHTTYHQTITATGRLSSTDPNLQNIPMRMELGRRIRKCFLPDEGNVFVDADYSQIELRVLAHMSGDENLIEAYRQEKDIHRITASQVFHTPFSEVTDLQRRNAKAVNFGIVYGISSFGLSQGLSITPAEAQQYIEDYFKAYPKIKAFLDESVATAKEKGYVTSLFGRRRPIPELSAGNFMQRSFGERVAMNSPIQGTAADIMKIAMIRVHDRLKKENRKTRMILQIHDELLLEGPKEEAEEIASLLQEEMAKAADLSVKLETDCHIGSDWYETK